MRAARRIWGSGKRGTTSRCSNSGRKSLAVAMSLFIFLTVLQALVGASLVGVILIQRSEGGGLGVGGSPSGLMSARGAANFLTRMTTVLATAFVILSIALAAVAVEASSGPRIDTSLRRPAPAGGAPADPLSSDPLSGAGVPSADPGAELPAPTNDPLQGPAPTNDPLQSPAQ